MNIVPAIVAAQEIRHTPQRIARALACKWFDPSRCIIIGCRRFFRREDLPDLKAAIDAHARISTVEAASA